MAKEKPKNKTHSCLKLGKEWYQADFYIWKIPNNTLRLDWAKEAFYIASPLQYFKKESKKLERKRTSSYSTFILWRCCDIQIMHGSMDCCFSLRVASLSLAHNLRSCWYSVCSVCNVWNILKGKWCIKSLLLLIFNIHKMEIKEKIVDFEWNTRYTCSYILA